MRKYEDSVNIKIGNICVSITTESKDILERVKLHYKDFISHSNPNLFINVRYGSFPKPHFKEVIYRTRLWKLGKQGRNFILYFPRKNKASLAKFNNAFNRIVLYTENSTGQLLLYLLPEILFSLILPQKDALLLHACGILENKKGYIFVAPSGGGKSTIAKLAGYRTLLNDDRVIICREKKFFKMHGTPWHGEVKETSNQSAYIDSIFFLQKAEKNYILPLQATQAMVKLLGNIFYLPISDDIRKNVFDLCYRMINRLRCYEFGFKPDKSIWRCLNGLSK